MPPSNIRDLLSRDEGRVNKPYLDSLGFVTWGVGHLCDPKRPTHIPDHVVDAMLDYDIAQHQKELFDALPWVADLDEVRRAVVTSMAFQLGVPGLLGFKNSLALLQAGHYEEAADNFLKSRAAQQTPERWHRNADMIRTGEWR